MKSKLKYAVWAVTAVMAAGALATPKLLPLMHKSNTAKTTGAAASDAGNRAAKTPAQHANRSEGRAPLKVATITVERVPFSEVINSTGTLRAEEGVELQAEINGKVMAINFVEGSHVKAGELLVKLNDADLRATRERALQRKELATLREHRLAKLVKDGVVRQEEYDTAFSELQVQNAEIDLAEAQIAKTEIRAPFAGVVGLRYVSAGAFVNAATRVATLQRLDKLKIDFAIPEKYASRLRLGSPILFSVAGGKEKQRGEIYAYDPRIDTATRTVLIRAICPNPEGRLLPGAFANVELILGKLDNAILIPAIAVIPGLNEKNVFVMKDGKAERRAVETGTRTETAVQILSGLRPGEVVIVSGLQQMRDGQAVVADGSAAKMDAAVPAPRAEKLQDQPT